MCVGNVASDVDLRGRAVEVWEGADLGAVNWFREAGPSSLAGLLAVAPSTGPSTPEGHPRVGEATCIDKQLESSDDDD